MALVLGYYDKCNLGDEQYKISISNLLEKNGFTGAVTFVNPYLITVVPTDTQIIICGGGDIINDWFHSKILSLINQFRGPVVALSVGITYKSTIDLKYLSHFNAIVLRHMSHMEDVAAVVGANKISSIPDIGFSLPPVAPIKFDRPRIGLFLAQRAISTADLNTMRDALAPFLASHDVVAYQMNTSEEPHEGDMYVNQEFGGMQAPKLSVTEIMSHIGGLDLAICMRYHAHVFAIVQGTPFVSLAVTQKTKFLLADNGFTHNIATVQTLNKVVTWALENRNVLAAGVVAVHFSTKTVLDNYMIPFVTRSLTSIVSKCEEMTDPHEIASYVLVHTVGTSTNKYKYGFVENIKAQKDMKEMISWLVNDVKVPPSGLKFLQPHSVFAGVHRSGWDAASKMLKVLESDTGTLCDLYVDATFHWNQADLIATGVLPYKQKWVGFIHHTPLESYTRYNTTSMFCNPVFLQSLKHCKCLFVLSTVLANWIKRRLASLQLVTTVVAVKHPTESVSRTFKLREWMDNPLITQVGAWMRDPYAIYRLQLPWGVKQTLEGPKMESYVHPTVWCLVNTTACQCAPSLELVESSGISRGPTSRDSSTVMTRYMTIYCQTLKAPSFCEVRAGVKCCDAGQVWPGNWGDRIAKVKTVLQRNYDSVKKISNLSNKEYDELLSTSVVFLNLLDCSAANTIIECIVRNTPVIVNELPAVQEYLGLSYPGFYTSMDTVWYVFNPTKIYAAHAYLKKLDKTCLMFDYFVKKVEETLMGL